MFKTLKNINTYNENIKEYIKNLGTTNTDLYVEYKNFTITVTKTPTDSDSYKIINKLKTDIQDDFDNIELLKIYKSSGETKFAKQQATKYSDIEIYIYTTILFYHLDIIKNIDKNLIKIAISIGQKPGNTDNILNHLLIDTTTETINRTKQSINELNNIIKDPSTSQNIKTTFISIKDNYKSLKDRIISRFNKLGGDNKWFNKYKNLQKEKKSLFSELYNKQFRF